MVDRRLLRPDVAAIIAQFSAWCVAAVVWTVNWIRYALRGICWAALVLVVLSMLASCSALSGDQDEALLVDLNAYSPLTAYTLAGRVLNVTPKPQSDCTRFGHIRDLAANYLLHDEGLHSAV